MSLYITDCIKSIIFKSGEKIWMNYICSIPKKLKCLPEEGNSCWHSYELQFKSNLMKF